MATDSKNKQRKVATPKSASKPAKENIAAPAEKPKTTKSTRKSTAPVTEDASKADAQPSKSRKRAADFIQGEDGEPSEMAEEAKSEKPKKKAKTIVAGNQKPSKVDGHPIKTAKIYPGGDMVEVEPDDDEVQAPKGKKTKVSKKEKSTVSVEVEKVAKKQDGKASTRSNKTNKEDQGAPALGELAEHHIVGGHDLRHSPVVEPVEKAKSPKGASKRKSSHAADPDEAPPAATNEGSSETKGSKRGRPKSKKNVAKETDQTAIVATDEPMEDAIIVGSSGSSKNTKAKKSTDSAGISQMAEQKPSKNAKTDKAKLPKDSANKASDVEASTVPKKSERSKKSKKLAEDSSAQDSTRAESSKSKKRKAPAESEIDDKISNVVDQLTEAVSAKKPKKTKSSSTESAGKKVKGLLSSGVEVAAHGVTAAKHYIEDLIDVTPGLDSAKGQISAAETFAEDFADSAPSLETIEKGASAAKKHVGDLADSAPSLETVKQGADTAKKYVGDLADNIPNLDSAKQGAGAAKNYVGDLTENSSSLDTAKEGAGAAKKYVSDLVEIVPTTLETAKRGARAAKKYVGELADSAQKSIMSDVTEVASEVIDEKKKAEKKAAKASTSKKGKEKAKDESSKTQEFGGFDDNNEEAGDKDATAQAEENDDEESEEDDQTAALLKGFESSGDEDDTEGETFMQGQAIPELPNAEETSKKLKNIKGKDNEPGVVYIGRIPHGFYEHEMHAYFTQFGTIKRLRLSRNKTTGKSKHFAFIEFASAEVAEIVAATMNNYLMFNHILKCSVVPKERVHEKLWKGANKRFKAVPWNKIQGRQLEMGMGREGWEKRIQGEKKRREDKQEKLKEIGYEFDGGELKGLDTVPVKEKGKEKEKLVEDIGEIEELVEERTVVVGSGENESTWVTVEEVVSKKAKRGGKKGKEAKLETDRANDNLLSESNNAMQDVVEVATQVAKNTGTTLAGKKKGSKKEKEAKTDIASSTEDLIAGASNVAKNVADEAVGEAGKAVKAAKKNVSKEKVREDTGGVSILEKTASEARKAAKEASAKAERTVRAPKEKKQKKSAD